MKLSPLDIQHKEFAYSFRGYRSQDVRAFLALVADHVNTLIDENKRLADELNNKGTLIEELQTGELELKRTIVAAERIGNEMTVNAKREAQLIIREAEQRKEAILRESQAQYRSLRADLSRLQKERDLFREQFRGMLKAFERSLGDIPSKPNSVKEGPTEGLEQVLHTDVRS